MSAPSETRPRLLLVISGDHGELAAALNLVRGCALEATLVLPHNLQALHAGTLGWPARGYASLAEVPSLLAELDPQLLLLFSAYLFPLHGLAQLEDITRLLKRCQEKGIPVVTSDPFLGLLASKDNPFSGELQRQEWLTAILGRMSDLLRGIPHLYPSPTVQPPERRSLCCFNPRCLLTAAECHSAAAQLHQEVGLGLDRPRWLFVLGQEDYAGELRQHGRSGLHALLQRRMQETLQQERQPILLVPPAALAELRLLLPRRTLLLAHCPHATFRQLLADAEQVFYWNIFSNSLLVRLLSELPACFFSAGHLARALPALGQAGLQHYYAGQEPSFLDLETPLCAPHLAALAREQRLALAPARAQLNRSPAPEQLVELLLRECRSSSGELP